MATHFFKMAICIHENRAREGKTVKLSILYKWVFMSISVFAHHTFPNVFINGVKKSSIELLSTLTCMKNIVNTYISRDAPYIDFNILIAKCIQ